jgi:hypothetical protein
MTWAAGNRRPGRQGIGDPDARITFVTSEILHHGRHPCGPFTSEKSAFPCKPRYPLFNHSGICYLDLEILIQKDKN